ncbi:GEVED domain-containing protein [Streptococcus mitis]|uniref:GEVED domain-containing protein n=1 Tax=Streptococcus mitis TaxID=28037 RepID=UPI001CBCB2AF|nr:GEVED domain-containing protein [Streptococcus mitis]MBZ2107200.1 YSIRK-type signal peptide-containing protein [Streptococcus mitis]MBZ2114518.1 YSIRK-type signal peptide-containing protein [Streptococcus mitis]
MKGKQQQDFRVEKYIRYGIRKYSFGAASVAIAAGLMFLGNGAVSATEVQPTETAISTVAPSQDDKEQPEAKVETVETVETVKPETEKATEVKPEVKVANKATLEAKVAALESKLSNAKYADASVVSSAKDVLATAKATLAKAEVSQVEVDKQVETVVALSTVVAESDAAGLEKKEAADKEAAKAEAEKTATPAEKALSVATTTLTQVSSEAEVTNKLAETELAKADVKEENKAAVTAAVAKNQAVLVETKALLADKSVTKEQVDAQLDRLNESILAVYNELKNAGINRDGKFSYVLADVADTVAEPPLSEDEQINHWKKYADKNTERLTKQIKWFDINNSKATVENLGAGDTLQVGTKFTQEISPGYVVTLTVTKLAPFNSTDEYKKRGGAGYDANAINEYKDGTPAELKVVTQGSYSVAKTNGMDTKGKTVIQSVKDGANVGVEFSVKSTLNGKEVPSNVVFLTGEEAGSSEVEIYKTDGDGFELVTELSNTTPRYSTARSYTAETYEYRTLPSAGHGQDGYRKQYGVEYTLEGSGKQAFEKFKEDKAAGFFNTTVTSDTVIAMKAEDGKYHTDGLGTQVFGPVSTHRDSGFSTPLVMTRNAKNIGMYIFSAGQQGSMLGFMVLDEGDAPASYGRVAHSISKSDGQKQPYLGSVPADVDVRTTPINKTSAFVYDDINGIGDADEGARQLMGDEVAPNDNYKLKKVNDGTYSMTFDAHLDGEAKAYVNGWIDFNGNGKFDEGEGAGVTEVTQDGKVTLTWTNDYQNVDTTATKLATRLRIAYDKADVKEATGIAYSGEVEDFQIQQTVPPRGTKRETTDVQGATQTSTVAFNAYGQKNYDFDKDNAIDTTVKSQIVKPDGTLVTDADLVDGYYVVPGQGKYKITDNGANVDVEFIPEANFVGTADGISIRRTDVNGNTTGWGNEGRQIVGGEGDAKDQLELVSEQVQLAGLAAKGSMDGRYIPTVTPKEIKGTPEESTDIQGKPQTKTPKFSIDVDKDGDGTAPDAVTPSAQYPAKLVDPATGQPTDEKTVTVKGEGTYTINPETGAVTFTPEPQFTGTAKGIDVSLTAPVGQDKNGQPTTATATAKYTPTVTGVTPTAEPSTSTGIQGETQKGIPTFTAGNAEVPIKENSVKLLNPDGTEATGPVDALDEKGNKVGEYTVNPATGEVTFTPTDKTYTGKVVPAKVQAEDKNGTKVNTTYTPHIVGVTPTATPAESSGIQGQPQDGTVSFAPGETTIEGEKKSVPIKANSAVLLDASGNPVASGTPVDALDPEGNKVGEYTIDPATNKVTFTPTNKEYKGKVQPAKVQAEDENGTKVNTTYTPSIVGVTPTASPAETTDVQGVEQSKEVTFKPGKATVNGVEKEVPIDTTSYKLLDENGQPAESVPAKNPAGDVIGTYTLKVVDGKATAVFTPTDKTYAGEVEPVTIQAKDTNGTPVTTIYTPNITPVEPTGKEKTTEGAQGQPQEGTPTFTPGNSKVPMKIDADQPAKLIDPETGEPTDKTTIPAKDANGKEVGTYTIDPTTGKVTFTPNKDFVGTPVPATVQAKDANGTPTTATYSPTVKPVTPKGVDTFTKDIQGAEQKGTPEFKPGKTIIDGKEVEVPIDTKEPAKLIDPKTGQPVDSVTIEGEGTYTVDPETGEVTFKPDPQFTGKGTPIKVQRKDTNGTPVTGDYTAVVVPADPDGDHVATADIQGAEQSGTPQFHGGKAMIDGEEKEVPIDENVPAKLIDPTTGQEVDEVVTDEGTYRVDPDGTVHFKPKPDFVGKAKGVTVKRVDTNGTQATGTFTPTVVGTSPKAEPANSSDIQGQTQEKPVKFTGGSAVVKDPVTGAKTEKSVDIDPDTYTLLGENGKPAPEVPAKDPKGNVIGKYTLKTEDGKDPVVVFTPTDKTYAGQVQPVTVQAQDKNGTAVTTTYTPNITPVKPTAKGTTSEGAQGQEQSGTPTFTEGNTKTPIDPTVPAKLIDPETGEPTDETSVEVPGEGTYTINPETGEVTFKPEPNFTGKAQGVEVQRKDTNGTPATAKYTPTVKPVTPTSDDVVSEDVQGAKQTGTPVFTPGKTTVNGKEVTVEIDETVKPTFDDGSTTKEVPGEGTYTIDENGVVTFTPEPQFTGKASGATVKRVDKNGTEITAQYTPTVKPVTPKAKGVTTTDVQGAKQTGTPVFTAGKTTVNGVEKTVDLDDTKPATFEDGSTTKEVPGEGTYTVAPDGTVTFTPNKDFTGQATGVTVKRVDKNGTPVTATYTPVVLPVTPAGKDVTSIGEKGKPQSETPVFTPGTTKVNGKTVTVPIDEKVAPTFDDGTTEKKVPGEGTYTIDKNGKVTFTPEKDFVGKAKGVTVKRVDENGTPVTATYTPTVLGKTTTENVVSEGAKGQPQSNTPVFKGDVDTTVAPTFKDGSTTKEVPGQGTYTIDATGKVTFTPEKDFVGKATPVEVVRKDKNGKTIKASYTPTVRPDTKFVVVGKDGKETEIIPSKDGKNPSEKISGYKLVKTETDDKGNTKHIYEPVTTKHVDKNGNPIPGTTTEEGTTPAKTSKELPGYKVVETRKLPNGDTEYVYEKVTTSFVDTDGHVIEGTTTEEGTTPKKDIPGYKFVETKTLENGDTEHVYERVTTTFKDKDGNLITVDKDNNPVESTEEGEKPAKSIPGYKFVETKKLPNGDVEHVYEKVTTPAPTPSVEKPKGLIRDTEGNVIPGFEFDMLSPVLDIPEYEYVETVTEKDGTVKHIYRKVKKSPLQPNVQPTNNRATIWTDENGNPLKSSESGAKEPGTIPGYEYVKTVTDPAGTIKHIFRKVEMPTPVDPTQPVQPVEPATPAMPEQPAKPQVPATPAQPVQDAQTTVSKDTETKRELPNTGTEDHASLAALGLLGVLSGFGLVARKKKED